jgi:hypothetical protein
MAQSQGGQAVNLNKSQQKLISERITSVWKGKRDCPICIESTVWWIGNIVEVREYNEGNRCSGAAITPLVQVQCDKCSHVVLFNAISLGVVDPETGKVKEAKP